MENQGVPFSQVCLQLKSQLGRLHVAYVQNGTRAFVLGPVDAELTGGGAASGAASEHIQLDGT